MKFLHLIKVDHFSKIDILLDSRLLKYKLASYFHLEWIQLCWTLKIK